jgi:cation diffusion facilitator family transporter
MIAKTKIPIISIAFAATLALAKLIVAIYSGSLAVLSSALDSLLDILSSTVNFFALKTSETPPDKTHPFGHGKFESLAAFVQAFIIFVTGGYLLWKSVDSFIYGSHIQDVNSSLYIMLFSVFMTLILTIILRHYAKKYHSTVILTDSMHYEIDLLTNSGVLVSVLIVKYLNFTPIDYIVSSIISVYIMFSAFKLGFEVSKELLDTEIKKVDLDRINSIIGKYDNLLIDYHKIRTRRSGKTIFVDMHVTMCKEMSLNDAHQIANLIEDELKNNIKDIDVIIHVEPCKEEECPGAATCEKLKQSK